MTPEVRDAFFRVKYLLVNASQLVIMNETDPLILYTDASTVSVLTHSDDFRVFDMPETKVSTRTELGGRG